MSKKSRPLTEEQWLNERSPDKLLRYVLQHRRITKVPGGRRQLWLFKIACCRLIWDQITDERSRHAVEVCEHCIEGEARRADLVAATKAAIDADRETELRVRNAAREGNRVAKVVAYLNNCATSAARWTAYTGLSSHVLSIVTTVTGAVFGSRDLDLSRSRDDCIPAGARASRIQADLARCIFGNPFRPTVIYEAWIATKGSTVARMARAIYDERAFDRLPVLSDALEEAGCTDAAILKHCREDRHHARGCRVVDALLARR
jgi:hypothetical protein